MRFGGPHQCQFKDCFSLVAANISDKFILGLYDEFVFKVLYYDFQLSKAREKFGHKVL